MKKLIIIIIVLIPAALAAQQFPFMEGYYANPFSLLPSYAGIHNPRTVFADYRSDWTGLDGGPETYQLSYNDKLNEKVGLGVRFIYDKTDIFKQTLFFATYTYEVEIVKDHMLNLGLSAGFFRNSIDLTKYYNNPEYVQDAALMYGNDKSKIKFASDISALYRFKKLEAGILFSNIMFGTAKYQKTDMTYKPMKNYQVNAAYTFELSDKWLIKPMVILRGGEKTPVQFEVAPGVTWNKKIWATTVFRTGGVYGVGFGGVITDLLILNYVYNMSSNVAMNTFGSHQITLGVKFSKPGKKQ